MISARGRRRWMAVALSLLPPFGFAAAPPWMHALVGATASGVTEKTEAVLLYADTAVVVQPNGKIQRIERRAYRILRPDGAGRG